MQEVVSYWTITFQIYTAFLLNNAFLGEVIALSSAALIKKFKRQMALEDGTKKFTWLKAWLLTVSSRVVDPEPKQFEVSKAGAKTF